jgi:hypothetical protein
MVHVDPPIPQTLSTTSTWISRYQPTCLGNIDINQTLQNHSEYIITQPHQPISQTPKHSTMRVSLALTLLPTLALSTTLPRQILPTGQTIKQDVLNIHSAVLALDATIQSFQGTPLPTSLIEGTPVLLGVANIHLVNRAGYLHALAAAPFSVEDSAQVIDTVVNTGIAPLPHLQGLQR